MQTHLLEEAIKVIPSPEILVNVISQRVRQLMNGHRPHVEVEPRMGFADVALLEVIRGKLTYEHAKPFVPEPVPAEIMNVRQLRLEKKAA